MCAPSTSASVMMMTLWYRASSSLNPSSPTPVPMAVSIALISVFDNTLSMRDFCTLRILPLMGRIAWNDRSDRQEGVRRLELLGKAGSRIR